MSNSKVIEHRFWRTFSDALRDDLASDTGSCWLVAVSGGVDSVVLLHVLHRFRSIHGRELVVVHFDHQLRGRDSLEDAQWVRGFCKELGVRCVESRGDVSALARQEGVSIEMAARAMRHAFFVQQARELGIDLMVTAHHADDQLEGVLMRLMRGSGPDGLSGMSRFGPSAFDSNVRLWRPFLGLGKSDLEAYATLHELTWREDRSNADTEILRNRVRHEMLPLIRTMFGQQALDGVLRSVELVATEHEVVRQAAQDWESSLPATCAFERVPLGVQREIMKRALIRLGVAPEYEWIERLRAADVGSVHMLPEGMRVSRLSAFPLVELMELKSIPPHPSNSRVFHVDATEGSVLFEAVEFRWRRVDGGLDDLKHHRSASNVEVFDADEVGGHLVLRHWRAGDRMHPIGASGSCKLQDLFVNAKVDVCERRQLMVLEAQGKGILWVQGFRIAEKFKVTQHTTRLFVLQWAKCAS